MTRATRSGRMMLHAIEEWTRDFFAVTDPDCLYNEASLQHELALFLRHRLPTDWRLYLERPAASFLTLDKRLTKSEVDIVLCNKHSGQILALELKAPRNGQYPEQMFKACQDLEFLEQLVAGGCAGGLFVMYVTDPLFYERGARHGIYGPFRNGGKLCGTIQKPTGARDSEARLTGSYSPVWRHIAGTRRFWLAPIGRFVTEEVTFDAGRVTPEIQQIGIKTFEGT